MSSPARATTVDRHDLWLSLLQRLTRRHPRWAVWKNVESALAGTGDVDSFAPPGDWPAIFETFREWVREHDDLGPVLVCRHIPQGPHFMALQDGSDYLLQLDVKERGTFRGSTLVDHRSLLPLTVVDERGIRRVRAGAEGVIKLCLNGTRKGGAPNQEGLRTKRVRELLAEDPEGVELAAALLGRAATPLRAGAAAVVAGSWDRRAMATVDAWSYARALAEPRTAVSRVWFLKVVAPRCPIIRLIREHDRIVPADRSAWLAEVAEDHDVYPAGRLLA